jgi:outer membrane receptor protein involved in Fe transport
LYGQAFRAPAFFELYNTNNPVAMGNPQLQPEIIETWEGAVNYSVTDSLHLAANAFTYKIRDKILFVPESSAETALAIAENAGQRQGHGLELEVRWKTTAKSSLLANYSFQQTTDEQTDHDVGYYPRQAAYLRADWLVIPNWYLDLSTKWIGERQRDWGDPRAPLAGYTMMNMTLRYKDIRQGHINLAFGIRNLLDVDAREPTFGPDPTGTIGLPHDLPLAGRNYVLEFRYQF